MNISSSVGAALVVVVAVVVAVLLVGGAAARKRVGTLRARGLYPQAGGETEADVLRLLQSGEKIMAIRCYREIHQVGLKEAKEAVERLERASS